MNNKHSFAFFYPWLPAFATGEHRITDKTLIHRLTHVVRVQQDQEIILFDQSHHFFCRISHVSNKTITVQMVTKEKNKPLTPHITVLLPILKRTAFEDALYLITELGANEIQLITTDKTTKWQPHDFERAERIIIAAAEQSKQFALPSLQKPISLSSAVTNCQKPLLIADIQGKHIGTYVSLLEKQKHITLLVGPEGDFSESEYAIFNNIEDNAIYRCTLTPTILRSEHAIALLVGIVRSMIS